MYDIEKCNEDLNKIANRQGFRVVLVLEEEPRYQYKIKPTLHPVLYCKVFNDEGDMLIEFCTVENAPDPRQKAHRSSMAPFHRFKHRVEAYIQASEPMRRVLEISNEKDRLQEKHSEAHCKLDAQLYFQRHKALLASGVLTDMVWDMGEVFTSRYGEASTIVRLEAVPGADGDGWDKVRQKQFDNAVTQLHHILGFSYHDKFEATDFTVQVDDNEVKLFIPSDKFEAVTKTLGLRVIHDKLHKKLADLEDKAERAVKARDEARLLLEQADNPQV